MPDYLLLFDGTNLFLSDGTNMLLGNGSGGILGGCGTISYTEYHTLLPVNV